MTKFLLSPAVQESLKQIKAFSTKQFGPELTKVVSESNSHRIQEFDKKSITGNQENRVVTWMLQFFRWFAYHLLQN